jgi:membrane dipeptidase
MLIVSGRQLASRPSPLRWTLFSFPDMLVGLAALRHQWERPDDMAAMTKKDALARVRRILDKAPLIDAHNDLPIVIRHQAGCDVCAFDLTRDHQGYDTDIPRLKKGRLDAQWWAAFVPSRVAAPGLVTLEQIDVALEIARAHPEVFLPATRASDVGRAKRLGRIASFVTVESGIGLQNSLAPLRVWYAAGVRLMTLCHNETLDWVDSSTDAASHGGLTGFGEEVVREMNRLGMIVDCAHTSNAAQHRVLDVSRAPVVFSHMNAFSLCNHPRNIADDVLDRLKANGGMVMATFVPSFISQDLRDWLRPATDPFGKAPADSDRAEWMAMHARKVGPAPRASLEQLCDHIAYMTNRAGLDHIGIGSDFFGGQVPDGLEDVSKFPDLLAELLLRGWSDGAIAKIAGGNFLRVFKSVERTARKLQASERPRIARVSAS